MDRDRDSPDSSTHRQSRKYKATFEAQAPVNGETPQTTSQFTLEIQKHPQRAVWVVGSCNGLICLAIDETDLFLWNPSTRKSRKLPPANFNVRLGSVNKHCYGFHESRDDYKVVGIFFALGNGLAYKSMVKIYSLKTNSWKRVGDFKGGVTLDDTGKFASGKLHWSASGEQGDFSWDIVSLDMESEVCGVVEQPNYVEKTFQRFLGVLGECICVLCNYEISADLWVLKEYGVKESWNKWPPFLMCILLTVHTIYHC